MGRPLPTGTTLSERESVANRVDRLPNLDVRPIRPIREGFTGTKAARECALTEVIGLDEDATRTRGPLRDRVERTDP